MALEQKKPKPGLPPRELEICFRLRDYRESISWSQAKYAKNLGLTRNQLANLEYGRTPLCYDVANKFCFIADLNQRWLATGQSPKRPYIDLPSALSAATVVTKKVLFSEVYDNYLADFFEKNMRRFDNRIKTFSKDELDSIENPAIFRARVRSRKDIAKRQFALFASEWIEKMGNHVLDEFMEELQKEGEEIFRRWYRR